MTDYFLINFEYVVKTIEKNIFLIRFFYSNNCFIVLNNIKAEEFHQRIPEFEKVTFNAQFCFLFFYLFEKLFL